MQLRNLLIRQKVRLNRTATYLNMISLSFLVIMTIKDKLGINYTISIPIAITLIFLIGYADDKLQLHQKELNFRTTHNKHLIEIIERNKRWKKSEKW